MKSVFTPHCPEYQCVFAQACAIRQPRTEAQEPAIFTELASDIKTANTSHVPELVIFIVLSCNIKQDAFGRTHYAVLS